jgi:plastocyanin
MSKRILSFLTAVAALATTVMPLTASAAAVDTQSISPGDLIKGVAQSSVYYFAPDGKRYVFPNEKTYFTWYKDFKTVKTISDKRLSTLPLGRSNVTYRPGVKMIKITTDPRTYAVDRGGILRHVTSQQLAETLYGLNWKDKIDDVADAFFSNYRIGTEISNAQEYVPADVMTLTSTIMQDKGFDDTIATVSIGDVSAGFVPLTMTVKSGTTVTWVNRDITEHQAKGASFDSGVLAGDATYSYKFTTTGSFEYTDPLHESMTATINVVPK